MRNKFQTWLLCLALAGCSDPEPAPPPPPPPPAPASGPEVHGLRAEVARATGATLGPLVELELVLEWTTTPKVTFDAATGTFSATDVWLLGPSEDFTVRFWGADDRAVGARGTWVGLPEAFRRRDEPRLRSTLRVDAPAGATGVSVSLGNSGLETTRVAIVGR